MDTFRCPECGRVSSVADWIKRPVCVHSWDAGTPEIWDGDNSGPDDDGRPIEHSPSEKFRTPGPDTWSEMHRVYVVAEVTS